MFAYNRIHYGVIVFMFAHNRIHLTVFKSLMRDSMCCDNV